jgi:hypothetical protein
MKTDISREREEILPKIEQSEEDLRHAVGELQTAVQRSVDARVWIAERPLIWLLGSFFVGLWLGLRNSYSEGGE